MSYKTIMKKQYQIISNLVNLLDNQFNLFGFRFGLSGVIGLIPGFGDILDAVLSFSLIFFAIKIGVPPLKIGQMIWNILVNFAIALIPVIGDATYVLRRVNIKNLKIINQYVPASFIEGKAVPI